MTFKTKVLIIDDEVQIRRLLRITLEAKDFTVLEAESGREGLKHASSYLPDIIVLDLGLPDIRGIDVLRELRKWTKTPVLILSVQDHESDKVDALEHGADDYVTKPFGMNELIARLRVSLRHSRKDEPSDSIIKFDSFEMDLGAHLVRKDGLELRLTSIEYNLLKLFALQAGRVLTHKHILREVWGPQHEADIHYLRIYIAALRKKIESDPGNPALLITEPGVGYRLRTSC